MKKVSPLEYRLSEILSGYTGEDLTADIEPRTITEEEAHASSQVIDQLERIFDSKTTHARPENEATN